MGCGLFTSFSQIPSFHRGVMKAQGGQFPKTNGRAGLWFRINGPFINGLDAAAFYFFMGSLPFPGSSYL